MSDQNVSQNRSGLAQDDGIEIVDASASIYSKSSDTIPDKKPDSSESNDDKEDRDTSLDKLSDPKTKVSDSSGPDPMEETMRPKRFDEIIGRIREKKTIIMMIEAARSRGDIIDHILFYGPPGLGKTTFAVSISNEVGSTLRITSGPAIERQGDLVAILTNLRRGDLLFIDEIHRLSRNIEEILYPAMEDGAIDIIMGKGPSAKTIRLNLEPFTLIGATTQIGKISSPMRERFGLVQRLDYFDDKDLSAIINRAARIEGMKFSKEALESLSGRSRGTGRVALRLYRRVRDYQQAHGITGDVTTEIVDKALDMLGVDKYGLEQIDRELLRVMYENFGGGPVGLSTLGAAISEDISTISDVYEPFLLQQGFLSRTSRGRVLTQKGIEYVSGLFDGKITQ